jgi:5-methylcytosine-specific restriction endonuclease McrA
MKIPATGELYGRSIPEWRGKSPDSVPPMAVQLRVLKRQSSKCAITGREIRPGRDRMHCDHKKRLNDGGENRESNLQMVLEAPHIEKTAIENSDGKKADRIRLKNLGMWPKSKNPIRSRGFAKRIYDGPDT